MKRIFDNVKKVDFFSVTYSPAISEKLSYSHSSFIGGISSIVIAMTSSIYCFYYLFLWWTLALQSKVTEDINQFTDDFEFEKLNSRIRVFAYDLNGYTNPFDPEAIVILPLILDLDTGYDWESLISNATDIEGTESIKSLDINFKMGKDNQFIILFVRCQDKYLQGSQKCASQEVQNNFLQTSGNILHVDVSFTTINPSTFEPQIYERSYPLFIHQNAEMCSSTFLHYQLNHYVLDKSFLFSYSAEEQNYISDSLNYPQYALKSYCDGQFLTDTYGAYWIVFQQQYRTISIGYPSISEVFAGIGSIVSILFSAKYLIALLNITDLRQIILDDLLQQYYPEIKQFSIKKSILGKIKSVKYRDFPVELDSFLQFQKQIHNQIACKLNYRNLLYEMSRIQFVLMSLQKREKIEKIHNVGIKVPLTLSESGESYVIASDEQFQKQLVRQRGNFQLLDSKFDLLQMNDAMILSQKYQKQEKHVQEKRCFKKNVIEKEDLVEQDEVKLDMSEEVEQDFYDLNQIARSSELKSHDQGLISP